MSVQRRGYLALLGGICTHLVVGHQYCFGTIDAYVTSYLKQFDPNLTMADTYIAIPSCVMISCVMMFFGAKLSGIIKHRGCAALGCGLICSALFLMSVITNWVIFLAVFIGFCGSAVGIGYIPALHCGWAYHPWIKGRITGTILTFFGFGAFIFSLIGTWIVNPENKEATIVEQYGKTTYKYFTADVYQNVPTMYVAFFFIYLGISCVAVLLLKYPDETEREDIKQRETEILQARDAKKNANQQNLVPKEKTECPTLKLGVQHKKFWILFLMNGCSVAYGVFMVSAFKTFGQTRISDDAFLSLVGALTGVFNGGSRFFWATWFDFAGFVTVYRTILIIQSVCCALIYFVSDYKALYLICVCFSLACMGGHYALFSTTTVSIFGLHKGHEIYGLLFYSFKMGSLIGIILAFGYLGMFIIFLILTFVSFSLTINFKPEEDWRAYTESKGFNYDELMKSSGPAHH